MSGWRKWGLEYICRRFHPILSSFHVLLETKRKPWENIWFVTDMFKTTWQVKCTPRRENWKIRLVITLAALVTIYLFISSLYKCFITYSVNNLMQYPIRRCGGQGSCGSPIPRIIHHTWKDENVPEKWRATWRSCLSAHKGYEERFWTDATMEAFIKEEYPWFLATYKGYPYDIQRADSFRLFALYHFGGIYSDLDVGCRVSVHDIMQNLSDYRVLLAEAKPTGIKAELMATTAKHRVFEMAISGLCTSNWRYGFPYMDVIFSTGPMFLTRIVSLYDRHDVYIMSFPEYNSNFWATKGDSWHDWDAKFFLTLFNMLPLELLSAIVCCTVLVIAGFCLHKHWCRTWRIQEKQVYSFLKPQD